MNGPGEASLHSRIESSARELRVQLKSVGVECLGISLVDAEGNVSIPIGDASPALIDAQTSLVERVRTERKLSIARDGKQAYLVACPMFGGDGSLLRIFVFWLTTVSETTVQQIHLAMGWLQLPFLAAASERGGQAIHLLEKQAHVLSQDKARSGAQEWVNRLAQALRDYARDTLKAVHYFRLEDPEHPAPHWWVSSDTAWAEQGASVLHAASDIANRAAFEARELRLGSLWAHPVVEQGELVGILVLEAERIEEPALAYVRASASVVAPMLGRWRKAERGLFAHAVSVLREGVRRLRGPGHLTWKAAAAAGLLAVGFLLLVPFDDHASGKVVVEGQKQYLVTSPHEGFWAAVLVLPGDSVTQGQLLARLDTRDLQVEQEKLRSERDQASGKLRQFFADGDSSGVQQSSAQLRQAEAELALVQSKLDRSEIRAPHDGMVISGDWRDQLGTPIEAGKKMFEIAAGDGFRVVLQIPEEEISRVRQGQSGEIRVTGLPHRNFAFEVNRVTAVASVEDHKNGFRIEAKLTDGGDAMRPGMQGVGKIVVGKANLLTIWLRPVATWLRMKLWAWWW